MTGWSGAAATSPTAASAGRSGRTRWCGTARETAAGSPPAGGGAAPWARAPSAAPILHSRGGKSAAWRTASFAGRAGRGGCGRPEPTPDGVPGGGLFPHAAEGGGFFRLRAGGHHRIGEPGRAAGHEDQPGPGGGSDPPAGGAAFVREGAPDGRTGDGGVAPVLLKKLQRNPKSNS